MRAAAVVRRHLGRRGAFLLIVGAGQTAYGASLIVSPPPVTDGLRLLLDVATLGCWAWLWIAAGVVTMACAWLRVGRDWAGFAAALTPPTVWAISYTVAALTGDYTRGVWVAVWYLTSHIGVIMWAAGVPEHSVPPRREGGVA